MTPEACGAHNAEAVQSGTRRDIKRDYITRNKEGEERRRGGGAEGGEGHRGEKEGNEEGRKRERGKERGMRKTRRR